MNQAEVIGTHRLLRSQALRLKTADRLFYESDFTEVSTVPLHIKICF